MLSTCLSTTLLMSLHQNGFTGDTLVATEDGHKPIEEIKVGDKVLSANPETGEIAYKTVEETYINETDELIHVHVNGEIISATPNHPFYVDKFGWTLAKNLKAGDILVLSKGEFVVVEWIQHEILENPIKVYNFEVQDFHTYFVGKCSVWVHNACSNSTILGKNMMAKMTEMENIEDADWIKSKWTGYQAQHIIPVQLKKHAVIKKIGMDINDAQNGMFLRARDKGVSTMSRHTGYHSLYNKIVKSELDKIDISLSPNELKIKVQSLQEDLRKLQESGLPLYSGKKNGSAATEELWERNLKRIRGE